MPSSSKNTLLAVLLAITAATFAERAALGLLLQDIKSDLSLTDTQLGLLTGIAFSLFYSVMGIPLARWADRGNRVVLIAITVALQGIAVALSGLAGGFLSLLLIRILVAVGEAGCVPASHSLIADRFSRAERPRAVAICQLGSPLSLFIGYFVAGWLNELYGWRATFLFLGGPAVVLALVACCTLKEPRRERATVVAITPQPSLKEVFATLSSSETFRHLVVGFSVLFFFYQGILKWLPAFLIRSYGLQTGELGTWFALIWGGVGLLGMYLGGALASRHAAHNERLQLQFVSVAFVALGVASMFIYLAPNHYWAFTLIGFTALGLYTGVAPLFATIQTLVPSQMRAMSVAIIYLFANLIGMGLGPLAVGALSDALRPWAGEESLRWALLLMCPGYFWAGWHFWQGSRTVTRDLAGVRKEGTLAMSTGAAECPK